MIYFKLLNKIYPEIIFSGDNKNNKVYLTFDDGPNINITEIVLDILRDYNVKATFFCVGENVLHNKYLFNSIIKDEHAIGNHTYNHLSAWSTNPHNYFQNIIKCNKLFSNSLFRPPWGKLRFSQISTILQDYKIVLWNIDSKDYNTNIPNEKKLSAIKSKMKSGSIILLHDVNKTKENTIFLLPKIIEFAYENNYKFSDLNYLVKDKNINK